MKIGAALLARRRADQSPFYREGADCDDSIFFCPTFFCPEFLIYLLN
jgi:hypothetical protein